MIYLLGSILLTSYLTLFFKLVKLFQLSTFHVIVFNYLTCVVTGCLMQGSSPFTKANFQSHWMPVAIIMGVLFIVVLQLIGFSAQRIGVAVTSVSYKLSLVIPFLFSIMLYQETVSLIRWLGVVLALVAVVLTCYPSSQQDSGKALQPRMLLYLIPALIFLGSGIIDTLIKYTEHHFLNESNKDIFLIMAFGCAAAAGLPFLCYQVVKGNKPLQLKAVMAGIILGVPNYFSIWCLLQVLKLNPGNSTAILPVNNMAIVLVTTVVAWLVFKEKLSFMNWLGVILALFAIFCITAY